MSESKTAPMQRVKIWLPEDIYHALKSKSERDGISQSEIARQALAKHLGEESASQSAPWLESLLDAVLAKHFQDFPQVLEKLIASTYANELWHKAGMAKFIELTGDKSMSSQDTRTDNLSKKISALAWARAEEFFQGLAGPADMIEPPESD